LLRGADANGDKSPLQSLERRQPLNNTVPAKPPVPPPVVAPEFRGPWVRNSFGQWRGNAVDNTNDFPPPQQMLWQPHYDREFASLGEVLGVPLYGPHQLTQNNNLGNVAGILNRNTVAAARVLFPDSTLSSLTAPFYDNLWYRIFEYLEVPAANGGHQNFPSGNQGNGGNPWFTVDGGPTANNQPLGPYRRFGKMNLNTLRDAHHLAGMLDDFEVFQHPRSSALLQTTAGSAETWNTQPRQ
jgi:hypothetical protein